MEFDRAYFEGKTAIVTGGAGGIGLALVEALIESGAAKVVLADFNQAHLEEQEQRLRGLYGECVKGILCNVTIESDVQRMIAEAVEFFGGRLDLLINNAGKGYWGYFKDLTIEDWKGAFDLNYFGALYGMRAALPVMVAQGSGQIVNIISGVAFMQMPMQSMYAATKAALNALSLSLRAEYWDDNIKISAATPGTTATAIFEDAGLPADARAPEESAAIVLRGVVANDRIIFGSDGDMAGGANGANYAVQHGQDAYLAQVARMRREGNLMAF